MAIMGALLSVLLLLVAALGFRRSGKWAGRYPAILRDIPGGGRARLAARCHPVSRRRGAVLPVVESATVAGSTAEPPGPGGLSRRAPRGDEFDIMTEQVVVLELQDVTGNPRAWLRNGFGPRR